MGSSLPSSSEGPMVSQLTCLAVTVSHEPARNSRSCPHYTGTKRCPRKLDTGHSSDYHVGLFIIFDVTTSPYPWLFTRQMQWRAIIKSFLEFFVLGFFIYLPKIPPHLLVQVRREEIGPSYLTTASVPRNFKGWLDLSLLRSTLSSISGKQTGLTVTVEEVSEVHQGRH